MDNKIQVAPCIIAPNKAFLIGAIYGFNAARKRVEENPQPLINNEEITEETQEVYTGSWLELTCAKCGAFYTFDDPNQIPETNLICSINNCGNHIILYGVCEPQLWRIGNITF